MLADPPEFLLAAWDGGNQPTPHQHGGEAPGQDCALDEFGCQRGSLAIDGPDSTIHLLLPGVKSGSQREPKTLGMLRPGVKFAAAHGGPSVKRPEVGWLAGASKP